MENANEMNTQALPLLNTINGFKIEPMNETDMLDDEQFRKLKLTKGQKAQVNTLIQQIPSLLSANTLAHAYTLTFPAGLPHTLMRLKQGGFATTIVDASHKIAGTASLNPISMVQSVTMTTFSVMSIATGQYFLSNINQEMTLINNKLDKILGFLYGDKKAELISEISFAKYAFENYASIMENDCQRIAVIGSLQQSQKVAMKDIEFYLSDLQKESSTSEDNYQKFEKIVENTFSIKDSLELSMQLYIMSMIMEVYFSQNFDGQYLKYVKQTLFDYIDRYNNQALRSFGQLHGKNGAFKGFLFINNVDKNPLGKKLNNIIKSLDAKEVNKTKNAIQSALSIPATNTAYHVTAAGDVYMKTTSA